MLTPPHLGTITDVDIRQAWAHEAHSFTPWLAANLDVLSRVIGIPMELEGTEVTVESFFADILARSTLDDSLVLIENQLAGSDHSHLGQLMTYLAGLEAKTVVWIATEFRDAHLSAINWLNEHTALDFAFFAVTVRVVRIGDSPLAPMFEVVARPNDWERRLNAAGAQRTPSETTLAREAFWNAFVAHVPGEAERSGPAQRTSNRWRVLAEIELVVSMWLAQTTVGLFVRGLRGASGAEVESRLLDHADELTASLGCPMGDGPEYFFVDRFPCDFQDEDQRDGVVRWLAERAATYEDVLLATFGRS